MKHNLLALLIYLLCLTSGFGQTYSVTKTSDDGRTDVVNSLSWAIDQANKDRVASTINFNVSSLTLTAALPAITQSCTISGASKLCPSSESGGTTLEGQALSGGKFRVFTARNASTSLVLQDLIITKAGDQSSTTLSGGGLYVTDSATALIERCVFTRCWAGQGAAIAVDAGAEAKVYHSIFQDIRLFTGRYENASIHVINASVFVSGSTFRNITGVSIRIGEGEPRSTQPSRGTITTSTISRTRGSDVAGIVTYGYLYVDHVTFHDNQAIAAACIAQVAGSVFLSNTLFDKNLSDMPVYANPFGLPVTYGGKSYYSGSDLLPLADNGGCTLTHALSQTSGAINIGDPSSVTADQRGVTFVGRPDAGAFEFVSPPQISGLTLSATTACLVQVLSFSAAVSNTTSGSFTYTFTNGKDRVSGMSSTSMISQSLVVSSTGVQTFTLLIQDCNQIVRGTVTFTALACPLVLLPPSYTCQTGAIVFNVSGGNGSLVEFMGVGITDWTNQANSRVDSPGLAADIRTPASTVEPIVLYARQRNADSSYTVVKQIWDAKATCAGAARSSRNLDNALIVTVLGNPTPTNAIEVLVESVQGDPLKLQIVTERGQPISQQTIENPGVLELVRLPLGQSAGVYLLHISTPTAYKTVKVIKM